MPSSGPIDGLARDWQSARPDLRFDSMVLFARLNRFVLLSNRRIEAGLGAAGVSIGEFEVLAALRRAAPPHVLKPSVLASSVMLTPAGMTNRLDRLETAGLIERRHDPEDRRSSPVALTSAGRKLVDRLIESHLATEDELFAKLTEAQRKRLESILRVLDA